MYYSPEESGRCDPDPYLKLRTRPVSLNLLRLTLSSYDATLPGEEDLSRYFDGSIILCNTSPSFLG